MSTLILCFLYIIPSTRWKMIWKTSVRYSTELKKSSPSKVQERINEKNNRVIMSTLILCFFYIIPSTRGKMIWKTSVWYSTETIKTIKTIKTIFFFLVKYDMKLRRRKKRIKKEQFVPVPEQSTDIMLSMPG
jgi:hypothetical protein